METAKNYNPINTASMIKLHSSSKLYESGKRFYSTTDNEAITNPNVTSAAFRILMYLLSNNESFSPNQKVIARKLSMSKNTVKDGIQNLIENGYLKIDQTGHNRYHYTISAISFQGSKTDPTNNKIQGSKIDPTNTKVRGQKLTPEKQAKNQGSNIEGSNIEGSKTGLLNNDNLNNENSNNENLNSDNFNSNSTGILDKKSSPKGSIFYSENFASQALQNVPQSDNVIFEKIKAESKIIMRDLPIDTTAIKIENLTNNESEKNMKIKLNDNEIIDDNEMFPDITANLKIEDENNKLDSINVSTAINDSAQENINSNNDSVHSAIDVITPIIEKTEQQKLNDNLYDKAFSLFGDGLYTKIDNLDAMVDDAFGADARKKIITNTEPDDTDWKPVGKIDTATLKANADKYLNQSFINDTSFDPTLDI